jgi:hypothetical protein
MIYSRNAALQQPGVGSQIASPQSAIDLAEASSSCRQTLESAAPTRPLRFDLPIGLA